MLLSQRNYLKYEARSNLSRIVFVNGQYCDYKKSLVHIEDRGYQFADGVYEVFTIVDSTIVDYRAHLNLSLIHI